jgi:glycosyltransferase involved in cell wall biosynthesis
LVTSERHKFVGVAGHRIGIDARYLSHGLVGGVHTYVGSLISAMLEVPSSHQFVLFCDEKARFDLNPLPSNAELRILPWRNGTSSVRNDLRVGTRMQNEQVDLAHFPANYGFGPAVTPTLITLHDAINLLPLRQILKDDRKDPRHVMVMAYLHYMTIRALRRAPWILTVSEYSKREIMKAARVPSSRIYVVHSAPDECFKPSSASEVETLRANLGLKSFVVVADAIKNPYCTLRAFRALPEDVQRETSLVFFSRRTPVSEVSAAAEHGTCQLLVRPLREELIQLYSLADVFVFPSWYEGFGLPVLEAMSCGTPVIASSRGSLPEITGDGGIIVDAEDHESIASELMRLKSDEAHRWQFSARARTWASNFSWKLTAERTLGVYDDVIGAYGRHSVKDASWLGEGVGALR